MLTVPEEEESLTSSISTPETVLQEAEVLKHASLDGSLKQVSSLESSTASLRHGGSQEKCLLSQSHDTTGEESAVSLRHNGRDEPLTETETGVQHEARCSLTEGVLAELKQFAASDDEVCPLTEAEDSGYPTGWVHLDTATDPKVTFVSNYIHDRLILGRRYA